MDNKEARSAYEEMVQNMMNNYGEHNTGRTLTAEEVMQNRYGRNFKNTETAWNYDMNKCPLDTKVRLLSRNDGLILPQMEFVGTITCNGVYITKGYCYEGNEDYFARCALVAWKPL